MTILSESGRNNNRGSGPRIDALDFDGTRSRLHPHHAPTSSNASGNSASNDSAVFHEDASLLSDVVDGIIARDRRQMQREVRRWLSYISAVLSALCAGSITAFSLYGHMFVSRLHYSVYNLNAISIAGELAMYLPVPIFGYFVDRYSPRPVALVSALFFATGYFLAAFVYRAGPQDEGGYPFSAMLGAFLFIGMGTSSMYLAAVTTCAKNFGKSKYKGLALAMPIAAFGLSGMWQSQIGSRLLYEIKEDGSRGNVDVFQYFVFLGFTLLAVGLLGSLLQNIVNEDELIEDAVEGLERSGLLGTDMPWSPRHDTLFDASTHQRYGTIDSDDDTALDEDDDEPLEDLTASMLKIREQGRQKKLWLLNAETHYFLSDHTMWLLALGFFLVTGPVETFINNLGTMLAALYPPETPFPANNSPATNVSVLALTSTFARIVAGILSDVISPSPAEKTTHAQYAALTPASSMHRVRLDDLQPKRFSISRLTLLIFTGGLLTVGYILLISPLTTNHPETFVAVSAILGIVNGAAFALVPLLISAVWGVQNFGTNWGIVAMMPALGATVWSALYSVGYQANVDPDLGMCFGYACYAGVSAGMAGAGIAATLAWTWIGWGRDGWWSRGVVV